MTKNQIKKGEIMKFIVGNWKSNGNIEQKETMIKYLKNVKTDNKVVLCVPFTMLGGGNSHIEIGAQDVSFFANGAFTGDVSAEMLKELNVKYVIVGHSERRKYHNETNDIVKKKAFNSIQNNIIPIICVGESSEDKKAGRTMSVVKKMVLESIPTKGDFIIAYEPCWAIGTGLTPTAKEIADVHETIFKALRNIGRETTPILYGGSVNSTNAKEIMAIKNVSGVLVGGASLKYDTFLPIINAAK